MSHTLLHHEHRMERAKIKAKLNRMKRNSGMKGTSKHTISVLQLLAWKRLVESIGQMAKMTLKK